MKIERRDVAIDTQLNLFKEGISVTQRVVVKIKLTIVEYRRDRNIGIYIRPTFSYVAETQQIAHEPNRAIWENVATGNCVLQLCLMKPSEVQPISHQHLAMIIMLKYLIYLLSCNDVVFLRLFSSQNYFRQSWYTSKKLQDYENIHGKDSFLILFSSYLLSESRVVARNFLEGASKSSKMSATMVDRRRKCWVAERLKR